MFIHKDSDMCSALLRFASHLIIGRFNNLDNRFDLEFSQRILFISSGSVSNLAEQFFSVDKQWS